MGVINKQIMAELAKALGPKIRQAHEERMKTGAHNMTVEMGKVSGIRKRCLVFDIRIRI